MKSFAARLVVTASAATFLVSAPAAAASRVQSANYSPWASLAAFASPASSQALCGAAAASAAASATAQAGTPGCVFPTLDAPVAPPVAEAAPVAAPVATAAGAGVGVFPLLLGLAALGGLAALLLANDGNGTQISIQPQPISA